MIDALSLFFGPLESPTPGNDQTGGVGLDQTKLSENPSDNPFAKILRDQSAASFPFDGQRFKEFEDFIPTSLLLLTLLRVNGGSGVGEPEIPKVQLGQSSEELLHAGQPPLVVFSPHAFLAEGSEADGVQTTTTLNRPGLPFPLEYSTIQIPPVGGSLADNSATHLVTNSDLLQFLRDGVKENSQLVKSSDGEPSREFAVESGTNVGKPLDRVSNPVQDNDILLLRIPPLPAKAPIAPLRPLVNQVIQYSLPIEETPASLSDLVQSSQSRLKNVNGISSLLNETSVQGKEASMPIPPNLLGDSSLSSIGDRSKDVLEVTGKSMGIEPNGGQGVNNGMGGSTHSQTGFQQSSSSLSQGTGARMVEDRGPDLPTPALQRLQMEVQLSETNRIQIDVGVQQRHVYAGLLMDHATLKNLAMQFVPQLEDQLAQSDMDLQEFSAEVRDHHGEPESEASSHGSGTQQEQRGPTTVHHAPESLNYFVNRVKEQGWHYVA